MAAMEQKQRTKRAKEAPCRGGGGDKEKESTSLPGYDSLPSSAPSASADNKQEDPVKAAVRELVNSNRLELPEALKEYFEPKLSEQIQSDQKSLNMKRKLLQKVDRLKAAKLKKEQNWELFKESMKEHLQKEKARFESDLQDIEHAIQETQLNLDRMITDKDDLLGGPEMKEDAELQQILGTVTTKPEAAMMDAGRKEDMMAEHQELIRQTQAGQVLLAQQMMEMQKQMAYFVGMSNPPMACTPPRHGPAKPSMEALSPIQPPKTPFAKDPQNPYGKMMEKLPALPQTSPYAKHPPAPKGTPTEIVVLDSLDGEEGEDGRKSGEGQEQDE